MTDSVIAVPGHVADKIEREKQKPAEEDTPLTRAYVKPQEDKRLDPDKIDKTLLERLPSPTGWRMLILPFRGKGVTDGGIVMPGKVLDDQELQTVVGYVLKMGPNCYDDQGKYPYGPWCRQGDWVIFARYSGSRFRIDGGEVRIINDDEVIATIADPNDIISY